MVLLDFSPIEPRNDDLVEEEASLDDEEGDGRGREVGGSLKEPRPRHSRGIGREIRILYVRPMRTSGDVMITVRIEKNK